ncbi:GtrA family protein [Sphingomonas sp. ID0503]|uniref:GtrA family protein n=1 Tax=Sphingomonas sp. ID0503 TaxID=3399691 RepID=UPI003AFB0BA4
MGLAGLLRDRALLWQIVRYGITGLGVTVFAAAVYWLLAALAGVPEQAANFIAWCLSVVIGFTFHSRFTFRSHGSRTNPNARRFRFLVVAVFGLGLNALWVWLMVHRLGGAEWWPIPLMVFATPVIVFPLNRRWVFG